MSRIAIGVVETGSIAVGYRVADAMLKMAAVELMEAQPVSPGKYIVAVGGDVASVAAAVEAGVAEAGTCLLGQTLIANLHPQVLSPNRPDIQALGIIETTTVAGVVRAADAAVKTAVVDLVELQLARGLGGKGVVTFTGDVASVQAGLAAGRAAAGGDLVAAVAIAAPHAELKGKLRRES